MFSAQLARCKESGILIGVHTNKQDTSKFDVGRVVACDDNFFLLASVSKFGRVGGFLLQENDSIIRIMEDSLYLKKIAALMRYYNEKQETIPVGQDLVYDVLEYCRAHNRIATIDIHASGNSDAMGYVEEIDFDRCTVKQISEYGKNDGMCSLLLDDISYVSCCSDAEIALEILSSELFDEMRFG